MPEHGPTGAYLSAKLCEWCHKPARYPICPQCLGAPPAREPFANFLPVEPAITDPAPRKVDPGAVTRKRASVLGLPVGTPRHEVDRAWANRERPPAPDVLAAASTERIHKDIGRGRAVVARKKR